jgi:hypothetical protein
MNFVLFLMFKKHRLTSSLVFCFLHHRQAKHVPTNI